MAPTADEDYKGLQSLAERLGLDDSERESFITSSMKRLGYKLKTVFEDAEPEHGSGDGDFFKSRPRERGGDSGGNRRERGSSGPWGY